MRLKTAKALKFTYQGDGRGNTRFYYGAKPMWGGQAFKINRTVANGFVQEMNTLSNADLKLVGGQVVDGFYAKWLEPHIPRTRWQRFRLWLKSWKLR